MKYFFDYKIWTVTIYAFIAANFHNFEATLGISIPYYAKVLLFAIGLLIVFAIFNRLDREEQHDFEEGSEAFYKFFFNWYDKARKLSIFCTDLKWLSDDKQERLMTAIQSKGNKASIYLKDTTGPEVALLRKHGVRIFSVDNNVNSKFRFSISHDTGKEKIIIRTIDKRKKNIIKFVEVNSENAPYIISFAKDVLAYSIKKII